jgi:outer membrane receptor protein involved in Fe transport
MTTRTDAHRPRLPEVAVDRAIPIRSLWVTAILVTAVAALPTLAFAQAQLSGRVSDAGGRPLRGALVLVAELSRSVQTDSAGTFRLTELPRGTYTVVARLIGYAPARASVVVRGFATVQLVLAPSAFDVEPITVTAVRSPSAALASPLPVASLGEERLARELTVSLAHAIAGLPGVAALTTGEQIGKPVIRGLSGSRVLVLDNGSRLEDYSWSDEDGPSVDARLAQRVEVIRGPASVLYGSDALGGVVNVIPTDLPSAGGGRGFARLGAELYGASNNAEFGTALRGDGAAGLVGWRLFLVGRKAASLHTPAGELDNTGFGAVNGEAAVGVRGDRADATLRIAHYGGEFKLLEAGGPPPADSAAGTEGGPERKASDDRAQLAATYYLGSVRLEANGQFERHSLIELSDEAGVVPATPGQEAEAFNLLLSTASGDLLAHHALGRAVRGVAGVSGMYQNNDTRGPIPLVPDARVRTGAAFLFEQATAGRWSVLGGVRFDARRLDWDRNTGLGIAQDGHRTWTAFSGDVGVVFRPLADVALAANVGRAWRAPNLFELYANGPRIGEARYEIGRPDLQTELGTNADVSVRWEGRKIRGEIAAYRNQIAHYVFVAPTAEFRDALRVYRYDQADARLLGGEASLEADVAAPLTVMAKADAVRGTNLQTEEPLPLVPPPHLTVGADVHTRRLGGLTRAHVGAELDVALKQTRLSPLDLPTDGYALVNLSAGSTVTLAGRALRLDLEVRNLFDTAYKSFLSRYKEFALNPGRNVLLRVSALP